MERPEGGPNWAELEQDPDFQQELLVQLQSKIAEKKFGGTLWDTHDFLSVRRAMEDDEGKLEEPTTVDDWAKVFSKSDNDPLVPEIGAFQREITAADTVPKIIDLAKRHNIDFTDEEIQHAKQETLKFILGIE